MNELPWILKLLKKNNFKIFQNGDYDLNIIGLRKNTPTQDDTFDDQIYCVYQINGLWQVETWQATTDPSIHWLKNPMRVEGTAILKEGQYRGAYRIGKHRGKYRALIQTGAKVTVWRDPNKDDVLDMSKTADGFYGINVHRAHKDYELEHIGKYSAGCQVFRRSEDLSRLLWLCDMQIKTHGWETFTYTLVHEPKPAKRKPPAKKKVKA